MRRSRNLHPPRSANNPAMPAQLALPLPPAAAEESLLRHAWRRARLPLPFEAAMQVPALAICLRCLGEAQARRDGAPAKAQSRRGGRASAFGELDLALAVPMA